MATISLASAKGGCGKTTLAILLSAELALEGYRVSLLDCDANQHATVFGGKARIPGFTVVPSVAEGNVLAELRRAEAESDVALVDLPGGSSTLALKALQRSNFVLVPAQASLPDVRDAIKTLAQIDDASELARAEIARALLWSRVPSGFESRSARHVRESVEGRRLPVFATALLERAAFRELHVTGQVPRQADPQGAAAANVRAITEELLSRIAALTEDAA